MARGGQIASKRQTRNKVKLEKKGSDESDGDYVLGEDDFDDSEDEYCSSHANGETEESLGEFEEEEEEEQELGVKKTVENVERPRGRKSYQRRRIKGAAIPRKKKTAFSEEERENCDEDDSSGDEFDDSDDEFCSSPANDETEESLGDFEEEEEDEVEQELEGWEKKKIEKVQRPRELKSCRKKNNNGAVSPIKKKATSSDDERDKYDEDDSSEYQFDDAEDEYFSSLANDETEESLWEFEEEEEEDDQELEEGWEKEKTKKFGGPRMPRRMKRNQGAVIPRKKTAAFSEEERENYDDDDDDSSGAKRRKKRKLSHKEKEESDTNFSYRQGADDFGDERTRKEIGVSSVEKYMSHCDEKSRKKTIVSYREEKEDGDSDDSDEDSDGDFTPDEVDGADDDEELTVTKKYEEDWLRVQEAHIANGKRTKRKVKDLRRTEKKKSTKNKVARENNRYHGEEFKDESPDVRRKKKVTENGRRRESKANSVSLGLSDYEYNVSEEEREQIRESGQSCRRLTTSLGTSSSSKMIEDEDIVPSRSKRQKGKGKEKVVDMKSEIWKQVCGICLSDEEKRTIRGILNCCIHYFCFACIMEWSKVESRCPVCKQRFATISKTARAKGGHDVTDAVIPIPERDQVYQPSEEDIRGYLDPYENVICSECHIGGDDELMLLCDICDTPAHTYCIGLGREVPEGSWYCVGCRPTELASPNIQDQGSNSHLSVGSSSTLCETFDLNESYAPETSSTQVTGHSPFPRYSSGDFFSTSGLGAFTLFERRRIQRRIQQFINYTRRQSERNDSSVAPVSSGLSLFDSQISRYSHDRITAPQQEQPEHVAAQNIYNRARLPGYASSLYDRDVLYSRLNSLRRPEFLHQNSTSTNYSLSGLSHNELFGTGQGSGHQQLHPCDSGSNTGVDANISLYQFREADPSSLNKEQVESMVKSHLKSLSRNSDLDHSNLKYIERTSTHTILAAVGLEHRRDEVYPVRVRLFMCNYPDRFSCQQQTDQVKGQCSSCLDLFVKDVVKEIMFAGAPHLPAD